MISPLISVSHTAYYAIANTPYGSEGITDNTSCGLPVRLGASYLIFDKPEEQLEDCNGSRLFYFGAQEIKRQLKISQIYKLTRRAY